MKPQMYLRIASVLTLVHSVLHTVGGVFGKQEPGPASIAAAAMQANRFMFMGVMRSFSEFYRGMGLSVTIFLTAEAVVFWLLGSLVKAGTKGLRPILATFMVGYLAFALDSYVYFFPVPIVMECLIALCLGLAMAGAKAGGTAESRG
jgi:hypothetical protein